MIDVVLLTLFLSASLLAFLLGYVALERGRTIGEYKKRHAELQQRTTELNGQHVALKNLFANTMVAVEYGSPPSEVWAGDELIYKRAEEEWPEVIGG